MWYIYILLSNQERRTNIREKYEDDKTTGYSTSNMKAVFCASSQADIKANLHDGLARVDRTAGDTWRRPRGEDILLVQVKQGIA